MANMATGGILSGILDGWRLGESDHRAKEQYEAGKRRAAKVEQRGDQLFAQSQDDRVRDQAWQDEQRGQQRQHWSQGAQQFEQQQADRAHALTRRPVLERREDEEFALGMQSRRLQMDAARQGMAHAAEDQSHQRRVQQREWDQAGLQDEVNKAMRAVSPAFMKGIRSRNWSAMKDAWNSTMGQHNGQIVDDITQEGRKITVTVNGQPTAFGGIEEFQAFVSQALDPTSAFAEMDNLRRAQEQQRAGIGKRGNEPAVLQETNAIFNRLAERDGESENERYLRAYAMTQQRSGKSRNEAGADFYAALMKAGMANGTGKPEQIQQQARLATEQFLRDYYPEDSGSMGHGGDGGGYGARGELGGPTTTALFGGPLITGASRSQRGASASDPIPLATREDAARLPKGTWVRAPNGKVGQIP